MILVDEFSDFSRDGIAPFLSNSGRVRDDYVFWHSVCHVVFWTDPHSDPLCLEILQSRKSDMSRKHAVAETGTLEGRFRRAKGDQFYLDQLTPPRSFNAFYHFLKRNSRLRDSWYGLRAEQALSIRTSCERVGWTFEYVREAQMFPQQVAMVVGSKLPPDRWNTSIHDAGLALAANAQSNDRDGVAQSLVSHISRNNGTLQGGISGDRLLNALGHTLAMFECIDRQSRTFPNLPIWEMRFDTTVKFLRGEDFSTMLRRVQASADVVSLHASLHWVLGLFDPQTT